MNTVTIEKRGDVALVTINNPPVNAASHPVRAGLLDAVSVVDSMGVQTAVLICAGRTFVAGADVREFGQPAREPHLPDVVNAIEDARTPWIAALHGTALGGGLELALGCRYRIAVQDARLGLPEVLLGLIPGAGGTVRLTRLIGPEAALSMIASGKPVTAQKALEMGLLDLVTEGDLEDAALDFAKGLQGTPPVQAVLNLPVPPLKNAGDWLGQKEQIKARARGQNLPLAAIQAVENAINMSPIAALDAERDLFIMLKDDPQSLALRKLFFAERAVSKMPRLKGVQPRDIARIGVVGGGTMGAGIAAACLLSGFSVCMVERDAAALSAGQERVRSTLGISHKRGLIGTDALAAMLSEFSGSVDYSALGDADLVIEAVFEDMGVKKEVFTRLDSATRPNAVLATNTSYLDIDEITGVLRDPTRLLGLHFFSPAHIMKLLEIVHSPRVADDVLASGFALAKRLGKIAVPAGNCDGFIANRMMSAYRREADYMLEDGALPQEIDAAMVDFGFPMGVFAMQDMAGLDIAWAMRKRQAATRAPDTRYVEIADQLCEMGRFGCKAGRGWYDYSDTSKGRPDRQVQALIIAESKRKNIERKAFTPGQIMDRILGVMQTEGRQILAEGIAESTDAINVVMANGYGYPRWRGGPM